MRTFRDPEHGSKSVPYGPKVKKTPPLYSGGLGRGQEAIPTAGGPVEPPVEPTLLPEGYDVFVRLTQYFSSLSFQGDVPGPGEPTNWTEIQALGNPIMSSQSASNSFANFLQIGDNGDIILNPESFWAQGLVALGYYTPGQNVAVEELTTPGGAFAGYIQPTWVAQQIYYQATNQDPSTPGINNFTSWAETLLSELIELPQFSFLTEGEFGSINATTLAASIHSIPSNEMAGFLSSSLPLWGVSATPGGFWNSPYAEFLPFIDDAWIAQLQQYYEENGLDPTQIWDPLTGTDLQFENYFGDEWVYVPDTGPTALTPPEGTDLPTQQLSDFLSVVWANGQDIDGSGNLDVEDYNILLNQIFSGVAAGDLAFDFDNNGVLDGNDYLFALPALVMYEGNSTQPSANVTAFSNQNGWWNADGEWVSFDGALFGPYAGSSADILAGDYTYMLEGEYDPSLVFAWTSLDENFSPMAQADYDALLAWWNGLSPSQQEFTAVQITNNPMGLEGFASEWDGLFDFTGDGVVDDNELAMAFYLLYGNAIAYNDLQGDEQFLVEQPAASPPPTGEAPPPPTGESPPPPTASMGGGDPEYPYFLTYDQMYDLNFLEDNWPPTEAPGWYQEFWGLIEPWFTTYDLDWNQSGGTGTPGGPLALGSPDFNSWWGSVSEALGIDASLGEVMINPTPGDNSYMPFEPVENPPAWADVVADGVFDLADIGALGLMYSPYFSIVSAFQNHPDSEFYNPTGVFAGASPAFQAMQQLWFDMGLTAENLWEVIYLDEGYGFYDPEMFMTAINEYGLGESLDSAFGWQGGYYIYNMGDEGLPSLLNPDAPYNGFYGNTDPFNLGVGGWEQVSQGYNISNFLDFLASFGGTEELGYDLNEDGFVGTDDLLAFLAGYSTGNVWQPSEISPDISGSIYDSAEYTVDEDPVVTEEQTYERGGLILKKKR